MINRLLSSVLSGVWAIEPNKAEAHLPIIARMLKGDFNSVLSIPDREEAAKINGITTTSGLHVISEYGQATTPESAKPGSIALIAFNDVITKYDQYCGGAGTMTKNNLLIRSLNNPNVEGVILYSDSPGGEAGAGERISQTINKTNKPVWGYVDGIGASAMYEILASTKNISAMSAMDEVGSIGTLVTITDYSAYLEKEGIKLIQLYADASSQKNIEVREALKGNTKLLQEFVNKLNDQFIEKVKTNRGDKIKNADAYKGKLFMAEDAISAGLIDSIMSFDAFVGEMEKHISNNSSSKIKTYNF
jgi:protease-4